MFQDRIIQSKENGTLLFKRFVAKDEGIYQCKAFNDNGTAFSEFVSLRQACNLLYIKNHLQNFCLFFFFKGFDHFLNINPN